ncbi:MAG: (2Fe-2S) ferredoxin domain-containing protein [Bryobacterales bacterium]|nr:(2Fe-2S) ferredoxin domain-containing protein [Bryobacterales bacterium]
MSRNTEVATTRKTFAQVLVCVGCCCGRTDKGHPEVPVDWLKQEWRRRLLPKKVHLTISGCLGPCDATNVVLVMMGDRPVWLGGLEHREHYAALADWASACDQAGGLVPLPASLARFRMERFHERQYYENDFDEDSCCSNEDAA